MVFYSRPFGLLGGPAGVGRRPPGRLLPRLRTRPYSAWSFARQLDFATGIPAGRLYRVSDRVEQDIYGYGYLGLVDPQAVRTFGGWNLLRNSTFEHTGGVTPTSWTDGAGGTFSRAVSSTVFAGETAWEQQCTTARPYISSPTVALRAGVTYSFSVYIEEPPAATPNSRAQYLLGNNTSLSGTVNYPVCEANPSGGTDGVCTTGVLIRTLTPATDGVVRMRVGLGVPNTASGYVRFSRPQIEVGTARADYNPRTNAQLGADNVLWSQLYDQTGAGRHFVQANAALMPYAARQGVPVTENGLQSAEFVATEARRMQVPSSTAAYNFLHTTGGAVYGVSRVIDNTAIKCLLRNNANSSFPGVQISRSTSEQWSVTAGRILTDGVPTNGTTILANTTDSQSYENCVVVVGMSSVAPAADDRVRVYENNANRSIVNPWDTVPAVENAHGDLTLGGTTAGSATWDGTITEAAIWAALLPAADRNLLYADADRLWSF